MASEEHPLAHFEIEQYELHVSTYEIEATSAADAIRRLFNGDGDISMGSEYIGTCDELGLSLSQNAILAEELTRLGVELKGAVLPSIRKIRRIDEDDTANES